MNQTRSLLTQLRWRLQLQAFCRAAATTGLAAGIGTFGWALFAPSTLWPWSLLLWGVALLAAAGWAGWTALTLQAVAALIDHRAETCDRFTTALAFDALPAEEAAMPFHRAAREECARTLQNFDFRPWVPWQFPRRAFLAIVPLVAVAGLQWWVRPMLQTPERPADVATVKTAEQLEQLAKKAEESDSPEMKKVAEALKKSAEQLRAEAKGETPEKAMLRELSALEEAIKNAQAGANDLKTLAEALAKAEAAKEAAEALKKADAEAGAEGLEAMGKKLAEAGDDAASKEAMEELAKALKEAAQKMQQKSELAEAAAQGAKAAQSRDPAALAQALEKMGQAVRQSRQPNGSSKQSKQSMQSMLSALRDMKASRGDQPQEGQGKENGDSGQEGPSMVMTNPSAGQSGQEGEMAMGASETPGGKPGSDHDEGSKSSPYGNPGEKATEHGNQSQIQGLLGEGESLHTLLPAKPGEEPAKAGYKALYEAAAPAAEDALEKENIPIGSRTFVRRYFESIRPKQ